MGDWTSPQYILSQVLTTFAFILLIASYFISGRYKLLATIFISNICFAIAFVLLDAWVGVAMNGLAAFREAVSIIVNVLRRAENKIENSKNTKLDWFLLFFWICVFTVATILTQEGFMTWFAYFGTIAFTISICQKNIFVYKILGVVTAIFWVIYNAIVENLVGTISETALLIFIIVGLVAYCRGVHGEADA